jgi:hypothetical protein
MRYIKLALVLLASAAMLVAADPYVGTWKLNPDKTKYKTGMPAKEQTVDFSEEGSDLHVRIKGTSSDGKPISSHFTLPSGGGTGKIIESTYEGVASKNISATQRETSYTKGGKVVYTVKSKLMADGKTMTVAVKGTNPLGQKVEGTNFYEKQ